MTEVLCAVHRKKITVQTHQWKIVILLMLSGVFVEYKISTVQGVRITMRKSPALKLLFFKSSYWAKLSWTQRPGMIWLSQRNTFFPDFLSNPSQIPKAAGWPEGEWSAEMPAAGCSSQIPAGVEAALLGEHTPCSETPEHPSCTEAKPVAAGTRIEGSQGPGQRNQQHEFPVRLLNEEYSSES